MSVLGCGECEAAAELLGVSAGADTEHVDLGWRHQMAIHHPDHGGTHEVAVLLDQAHRHLLDHQHDDVPTPPPPTRANRMNGEADDGPEPVPSLIGMFGFFVLLPALLFAGLVGILMVVALST